MSVLLWLGAVVLVITGLVGIIMPVLPGTLLIFGGLLLGAWADGFERVGILTVGVLGVLAVASYFVDMAATAVGAQRFGASPRAMVGAGLGAVLGLFIGIPGLILGPFIGAVLGELTATRDLATAGHAGLGAWLGFAVGVAVKVGIGLGMVAIFVFALVAG